MALYKKKSKPLHNILDYVSSFREELQKAGELARGALSGVQNHMKKHFASEAAEGDLSVPLKG